MQRTVELNVWRVEEAELLGPHVPHVELLYHHLVAMHGGHMEGSLPHLIPHGEIQILVKIDEPPRDVLQFLCLCGQVKWDVT